MTASGPVVVLTGAAGHLGRAIADGLAARGARLLLVDLDGDALVRVGAALPPGTTATLATDVTAPDAPAAAFDAALAAFGRVDALVNNAGIEGPVARIEDVPIEALRRVMEVNVIALAAFSQEAVRRFRAQGGGRIVNIASGAGLAGTGLMTPYSTSKHAVVGLTRSVAREVADAGITVNAVCPGCVDSPMMGRIEARLGELQGRDDVSFVAGIPAGRYCRPDEVADAVAWLALDAPPYVNGTAMVIDGAMRA
jgi:NAD(P)-dependent dehydrogenase (short-subunit alcohol dehydrogenase family)